MHRTHTKKQSRNILTLTMSTYTWGMDATHHCLRWTLVPSYLKTLLRKVINWTRKKQSRQIMTLTLSRETCGMDATRCRAKMNICTKIFPCIPKVMGRTESSNYELDIEHRHERNAPFGLDDNMYKLSLKSLQVLQRYNPDKNDGLQTTKDDTRRRRIKWWRHNKKWRQNVQQV